MQKTTRIPQYSTKAKTSDGTSGEVPVVSLNLHNLKGHSEVKINEEKKTEIREETKHSNLQSTEDRNKDVLSEDRRKKISNFVSSMQDDQKDALVQMIYEKSKQISDEYHINVYDELTKTVN
jgi:hypothetical protein